MNDSPRNPPKEYKEYNVLPPEITWKYPGKFIIFSEDQQKVIGVGVTEEEAFDQAKASGVNGLWHGAYCVGPDEINI